MKPIETKSNAEKVIKNLGLREPVSVTASRAATISDFGKTIKLTGSNVGLTLPASLTKDGHIKVIAGQIPIGNRVITVSGGTTDNLNSPGITYAASTSIYFEDNNVVSIDCYYKQIDNKWYIQPNAVSKVYDIMNYGAKGDGIANDSAVLTAVIARAEEYSTILLPKTHLIENITINKSLKFVSAGPESQVIQNNGGAGVFKLSGSNIEVEFINLDFLYTGSWVNNINPVIGGIAGADNSVIIRNCICKDFTHFVYTAAVTLETLIVDDCEIYYTHGRASGGAANVAWDFPAVPILGGAKYTYIRNNFCNCLVDSTFTDVDPLSPVGQRTPVDGFYKTAGYNPEVIVVTGNTCLNNGIEAILVEKYPAGRCSALISNNVIVGTSYKSDYFGNTMPAISVTNCYEATISNNKISNCFSGIDLFYTLDTDSNHIYIQGNTLTNVKGGIGLTNGSDSSIISDNHIRLSSEHSKNLVGQTGTPAYCELVGIVATRGTVMNNVIEAEDPLWDASLNIVSRAANVFTVTDATGVINSGWLIAVQNGILQAMPVTAVAGNVITVDAGWAVNVFGLASGPIYYQIGSSNPFNVGAVWAVGSVGQVVRCYDNVFKNNMQDFTFSVGATVIDRGNKKIGLKAIARPVDSTGVRITSIKRLGDSIIDDYVEPVSKTRQLINVTAAPITGFGFAALNSGSAEIFPSGLRVGTWVTLDSSAVSNFCKLNQAVVIIDQPFNANFGQIDFDRKMAISFNLAATAYNLQMTNDTTCELLFCVGVGQDTVQNAGDGGLVTKGFGLRLRGSTLSFLHHNGTTQTVTALTSLLIGQSRHIAIKTDGLGGAAVEILGLVIPITGMPTGLGVNFASSIIFQAWNKTLADPAVAGYFLSNMEIQHD